MNSNKKRQSLFYDKYHKEYEEKTFLIHNLLKPYTINKWKRKCINKDILDIGCGNAYVLNELYKSVKFKSYTGVDISGEMIKRNSNYYKFLYNVTFFVDDVEKLENAIDKNYDVVVSYGCLHHLENPEKGIKSLYAKLRNNGYLLAVEMNRNNAITTFPDFYIYILGLDVDKIKDILRKIKQFLLRVIKLFYISKISPTKRYQEPHPGHPGKRTPSEYYDILDANGFRKVKIDCLYIELLPKLLYKSVRGISSLMVSISKMLLKIKRLEGVGSILIVEAKKEIY